MSILGSVVTGQLLPSTHAIYSNLHNVTADCYLTSALFYRRSWCNAPFSSKHRCCSCKTDAKKRCKKRCKKKMQKKDAKKRCKKKDAKKDAKKGEKEKRENKKKLSQSCPRSVTWLAFLGLFGVTSTSHYCLVFVSILVVHPAALASFLGGDRPGPPSSVVEKKAEKTHLGARKNSFRRIALIIFICFATDWLQTRTLPSWNSGFQWISVEFLCYFLLLGAWVELLVSALAVAGRRCWASTGQASLRLAGTGLTGPPRWRPVCPWVGLARPGLEPAL